MKGLSLTLTIVIVAIVLLVTALVIMTIFGAQMAQIMGVLNPWSSAMLETNLCQQACSTWCSLNPGDTGPDWGVLKVTTQTESAKSCELVMRESLGPDADISGGCKCLGLSGG